MKKRNIIFICIAILVIIAVALTIYFVVRNNKNSNNTATEKIILTKYDNNFEIEKTIEIKNKKQLKELKNICENPSLEQNDETPYLAIKNDVKLDLGDGKFFVIQLNLENYCYYEDTNTKLVIKMPEGLLEKVNSILNENV